MNIKELINKKNNKKKLSYEEIEYVIKGYLNKTIIEEDIIKFILAIYYKGMSDKETYYLTDVMVKSGSIIDLSDINRIVVDKHSTGGVGDKTTLLIAPIVASLGLGVAKMSGRSLGFTGGTIDKLESIKGYKLNLNMDEFKKMVNEIGCSVISQSEEVAKADKKIYAIRDEINAVDSIPLITSSIMSKKIASGANNIVIDLKVGSGAFMKNIKDATKLAKSLIYVGKLYKKRIRCILTNMNYPLGYTVGNALEIKEVMDFFNGKQEIRLKKLVIDISSNMVSIGKNISYNKSKKLVLNSINTGLAKKKFYEWIENQGGNLNDFIIKAKEEEVHSTTSGYINNINSFIIAKLVHDLGGGREKKEDTIDYEVGIYLNKTIGDYVKKGEVLGKIYYNKKIKNANNIFRDAFTIESTKKKIGKMIIKLIK